MIDDADLGPIGANDIKDGKDEEAARAVRREAAHGRRTGRRRTGRRRTGRRLAPLNRYDDRRYPVAHGPRAIRRDNRRTEEEKPATGRGRDPRPFPPDEGARLGRLAAREADDPAELGGARDRERRGRGAQPEQRRQYANPPTDTAPLPSVRALHRLLLLLTMAISSFPVCIQQERSTRQAHFP